MSATRVRPDNYNEWRRSYRAKNKTRINARWRERYAMSTELREHTQNRGRKSYQKHREKRLKAGRLWYAQNFPEWNKRRAKTYREKYALLRRAALAHLGGKCKVCGFSDARALQIDHVVGGNGWKRNRNYTYYREVITDTSGQFQLLCANHNWIKAHKQGEVTRSQRRHF